MLNQKYTLRYLPLLHEELESAELYIANRLGNPTAAENRVGVSLLDPHGC